VGSDIGLNMTPSYSDFAFSYYDYSQFMTEWMVRQRTPDYRPAADLPEPRRVVLAAVHAYLGWGALRSAPPGDPVAVRTAVAAMRTSLGLWGDNLNLRKLLFLTLADAWTPEGGPVTGEEVLDAFFAYATQFPPALMNELHRVLPVARHLGREDLVREILDEWYRFRSVVEYPSQPYYPRWLKQNLVLHAFEDAFPDALKARIAAWKAGTLDRGDLTQLERGLFAAMAHREWQVFAAELGVPDGVVMPPPPAP
jgi:hypothetical protein